MKNSVRLFDKLVGGGEEHDWGVKKLSDRGLIVILGLITSMTRGITYRVNFVRVSETGEVSENFLTAVNAY
jgi:hypothetical protein